MTSEIDTIAPTLPAPSIDRSAGSARLNVDGEPFYIRGVELHNSTASSGDALAQGLDVAKAIHANVALASIAWESIEPTEGVFDLSSVERIITQAREARIKLVLLWFGAWKNGSSSYAPGWVKKDWTRFTRCALEDGTLTDTLSPFGAESLDQDAFQAVLHHLEEFDGVERTVLMVQIENEIGLLGGSRDHSAEATAAFESPVPVELHAAIRSRAGFSRVSDGLTWDDVDEDPLGRDEAFMAWGYATHVQKLAAAGRQVTGIPFFVNAWLDSDLDLEIPGFTVAGGQKPGMYPSGGPLPRVADVWTAIATDIDIFAPDVYFGDLNTIYTSFTKMAGGLFIPEQRTGVDGVGAAFLAWGEYAAMGVSPFGVDSRDEAELSALADGYRILRDLTPYLTAPDGSRRPTHGFHLTDAAPEACVVFGETRMTMTRAVAFGVDPSGTHGYGVVVDLGDHNFLFAGRGFHAVFESASPSVQMCVESVDELGNAPGAVLRRLNGDETGGGTRVIHPPRERTESPFPIASGRAHAGISRLRLYTMPRFAQ